MVDSEGLQKRRQYLQFCVQVFFADTEFHELIRKENTLGVLFVALVKANSFKKKIALIKVQISHFYSLRSQ